MERSIGKTWPAAPLLIAVLGLPLVTFIVTYSISLTTKRDGAYLMSYPAYFLSSSIDSKPASCIGTFGLSLSFCCVPIAAFIRHARVKWAALALDDMEKRNKSRRLNTYSLKTCVVAVFAGFGVASFQSEVDACGGTTTIIGIHLLFALVFFVAGMHYCVLQYRIDLYLPNLGTPRERWLRKWFARMTVLQLFMLILLIVVAGIILAPIALNRQRSINNQSSIMTKVANSSQSDNYDETLTSFPPEAKAIIFVCSLFEISMLITFMSTFLTYFESFRRTSFALVVMDQKKRYTFHEHHRHTRSPDTPAMSKGSSKIANSLTIKSDNVWKSSSVEIEM